MATILTRLTRNSFRFLFCLLANFHRKNEAFTVGKRDDLSRDHDRNSFIESLDPKNNAAFVSTTHAWEVRYLQPSPPLREESGSGVVVMGPTEERLSLIFPGTKWCGSGNVADGYNDLGSHESTDQCCRQHDSCDDVIEAGQSAHGLNNNGLYSKLSCDCDQLFLDCLKADSSKTSFLIGVIYFNGLNTQCFKEDYPIIRCAKYYLLTTRCKEYELNTTATKLYQFFDVPLF